MGSMNRRRFLVETCGAMAGILVPAGSVLRPPAGRGAAPPSTDIEVADHRNPAENRQLKLILVIFGGGTRYGESMGDPQHRHIPRLWNDLAPRGTLFDDVRVEGRVVHTNCTASVLTGHREYDADNNWSRPVEHPTVFEIFRKARLAPDTATWAFVYASILANTGRSLAAGFGPAYGANVVEPPTIPRETAERIGARLQQAAAGGSVEEELTASSEAAFWARRDSRINLGGVQSETARQWVRAHYEKWKAGTGTTSHDAFLVGLAIASMRAFAPGVITVAFGEIDCAHYGSWSRYVEAIERTDALTCRLWQAAQELRAYRGRTLMLIVPDHGRELEREGGPGYVHHSNFYTREGEDEGCRRVWMLLTGPAIAQGKVVATPIEQTSVAGTALEFLGLEPSVRAASSVLGMARM